MAAKKVKEDKVLMNWMKEFFPYAEFKKIGFFTKEMRGNYQAQAERVCNYFGFNSVYEYGQKEIRCHISYGDNRPLNIDQNGTLKSEPFITAIPSVWDDEPNETVKIDSSKYDEDDEEPDDGDADSPVTVSPTKIFS